MNKAEWQTVLKFLQCCDDINSDFHLSRATFTHVRKALQLVIRHCGTFDPSWSELTHYVNFLHAQLSKVNETPYCGLHAREDLVGFRRIVVRFMLRMAKDFATPSLNIAEQTPGLSSHQHESTDVQVDLMRQYGLKRAWESENHPYLFLNEDSSTFTPLGFFVHAENASLGYSLVDCKTKELIDEMFKESMSRKLVHALKENGVNIAEDFDDLKRCVFTQSASRIISSLRLLFGVTLFGALAPGLYE
ncbi:E3 ubiquitin-protein ligase rnf213-alpha-like [Watersipora subatra]|uniref:E3 ubiquitin-protein ligase rnf213-alpha-like n=1 Tax=Watersipora subatra TaxID=2589382 RepID=UPI00355BC1A1